MKQVHVTSRSQWRRWLAENPDQQRSGIWLVFNKKETGRTSLSGPFHKCVNVFLDPVSGWLGIVAQMGGLA